MEDNNENLIQGREIRIGARVFVVPPLNFKQLERFGPQMAKFSQLADKPNVYSELVMIIPVIGAAIRRNYPDVTDDELGEMLDLSNYRMVFESILGVSGITDEMLAHKVVSPGESRPVVVDAR